LFFHQQSDDYVDSKIHFGSLFIIIRSSTKRCDRITPAIACVHRRTKQRTKKASAVLLPKATIIRTKLLVRS